MSQIKEKYKIVFNSFNLPVTYNEEAQSVLDKKRNKLCTVGEPGWTSYHPVGKLIAELINSAK
jgi:hypothetical protein